MRKIAVLTMILLVIPFLPLLAKGELVGQTQPVDLYFYHSDTKEYYLKTERPSTSIDDSVAIPFGSNHIEINFTTDTLTKILISGNFSFRVWVSSDITCMVELILNLQAYYYNSDSWENIAGFYRRTSVQGELELSGSKTLAQNITLTDGDKLGVNILLSVEGGYDVKLLFGSDTHPSRITLDSFPIFVIIGSNVDSESKTVIFQGSIKDAFGHEDIKMINSEISGPVSLINIVGPKRTDQENEICLEWTWDYDKDNAKNGTYCVHIECTDASGNKWDFVEDELLTFRPGDTIDGADNISNGENDQEGNKEKGSDIPGFETFYFLVVTVIVILFKRLIKNGDCDR